MDASIRCFKINSPKIISETIDGETIIINLDSGLYFSLNRVAGDIWNSIDTKLSLQNIVERLGIFYSQKPSDIADEVNRFVSELQAHDLISPEAEVDAQACVTQSPLAVLPGEPPPPFDNPKLQIYNDMQNLLLLDPVHDVDEMGWPQAKA